MNEQNKKNIYRQIIWWFVMRDGWCDNGSIYDIENVKVFYYVSYSYNLALTII